MSSSAQQISMPFLSPEVASHTFPEFMGAWNSLKFHTGEIRTTDGRTLAVSARLLDSSAVTAIVNGEEYEIGRAPFDAWIFRGDSVAQVISAVAIGQKPALFAYHEEQAATKRREEAKRNRRTVREVISDTKARLKQKSETEGEA
ncbi:MAG: hypothetical protein HPY82_05930 [Gammaproteobacteria bacterium]|nr:hypothetical protein [Gammaproteobacteria bacterium]